MLQIKTEQNKYKNVALYNSD